jgi:hypothetical protein
MSYNNRNKIYKVVNAKVNKQLINDELELHPITSKKPPILQLILERLDKIDNRLDRQDEFNKKIEARLDKQDEFNNEIRTFMKNTNERLVEVEKH